MSINRPPPQEPAFWGEVKTQRPLVKGLLVWAVAMACGCVLLKSETPEDWVSLSVSDGQGADARTLVDPDCATPPAGEGRTCVETGAVARVAQAVPSR